MRLSPSKPAPINTVDRPSSNGHGKHLNNSAGIDLVIERLKEKDCEFKERRTPAQNCRRTIDAHCPAHTDNDPSLVISETNDGNVLFKCHTGCETEKILKSLGSEWKEIFPAETIDADEAEYDYKDADGRLRFGVSRKPGKHFVQFQVKNGQRIYNLNGVERILYKEYELAHEWPNSIVFFCEGEKDVETLFSHELPATTKSGGAKSEFLPQYLTYLRDKQVVILHDNDPAGRECARKVLQALQNAGVRSRWLKLPDLTEKGEDVTDWLKSGKGTRDTLLGLAQEALASGKAEYGEDATENAGPKIERLTNLMEEEFKPIEFVVPGIIPTGFTELAAREKSGKSRFARQLGVATASGGTFLGRNIEPRDVLYLCLEDGRRILHVKMRELLGDKEAPERFEFCLKFPKAEEAIPYLKEWLQKHPKGLVEVDTLKMIKKKSTGKRNMYDEDYEAMEPFKDLSNQFPDAGIVALLHCNKMKTDDPFDKVSGSTGNTAVPDTIMVLTNHRGKEYSSLDIKSRIMEPQEFAIHTPDSSTGAWEFLGDVAEINYGRLRAQIIEAFTNETEPLSLKDISEGAELPKDSTLRSALSRMVKDGQLRRIARGSYLIVPEKCKGLKMVL